MKIKPISEMPKKPKYNEGETVTMKSPNLYGEKVGVISRVERIYKEVDRFTGKVDPHGLATMEGTISSMSVPYEFDGETLVIKYPDGRERKSIFSKYGYTIKSAKMNSLYSESGITRELPKPEQVGEYFIVENFDGNNGSFEPVTNGGPEVYVTNREGVCLFKDTRHEAVLWIYERHGVTPLPCPTCKGKKTVTMTVHEYGKADSKTESVIGCVTCHETGRVTPAYAKEFKRVWGKENWCSCKNSSGSSHTRKGGQDYYHCDDCGKTTQIG